MVLLGTEIKEYKVLEMYYLQGIRNNETTLNFYSKSNEKEKLLILESHLNDIDINKDFKEEHIFLKQLNYSQSMLYVNMDDVDEELKESFEIYRSFYDILDIVILKKWEELKKDLCKYTA